MTFFMETNRIPKYLCTYKRLCISRQGNLEMKRKFKNITSADIQIHHNATSLKTTWHWYKNRQERPLEIPERNPLIQSNDFQTKMPQIHRERTVASKNFTTNQNAELRSPVPMDTSTKHSHT